VEQKDQRADFARLASQKQIILLFYDEELRHRLTKGLDNVDAGVIENIIGTADAVRARIPAYFTVFGPPVSRQMGHRFHG
jgi:hypothetical protein